MQECGMNVLVLNCGSSSLKYAVFETESGVALTKGLIERIGSGGATLKRGNLEPQSIVAPDHTAAIAEISKLEDFASVRAVGHRVVHGGETFIAPVRITPEVMLALEANAHLAPLHNPPNIAGIRAAQLALPGVPQVAVFDTGFHATLPAKAFLYAIPKELYEQHKIRRYGFHGTSHEYVASQAARILEKPLETLKLVSLHLGNGASACAILHGASVDTTMGFTPLEGLVMGTRSGDLDAGVVLELAKRNGVFETLEMLNKKSGMQGLSGFSDLRDVHARAQTNDPWAKHALEVFAYRVQKTIGAYSAAMNGLDAVIFTAGVGENDIKMRARILENLEFLGLELDPRANARGETVISSGRSRAKALVIPTAEEWAIARATSTLLGDSV
jgi:acetate kinase